MGHALGRVLPQLHGEVRLLPRLRLLALGRARGRDSLDLYDWERAPDTQATWRIGDGTAAFYNYVYYTVAGLHRARHLPEQPVREGDDPREALDLVKIENQPRYANIKWYLDAVGLEFDPSQDRQRHAACLRALSRGALRLVPLQVRRAPGRGRSRAGASATRSCGSSPPPATECVIITSDANHLAAVPDFEGPRLVEARRTYFAGCAR